MVYYKLLHAIEDFEVSVGFQLEEETVRKKYGSKKEQGEFRGMESNCEDRWVIICM